MADRMNGNSNGSLGVGKKMNGINGHSGTPRRRTTPLEKPRPTSFVARLINIVARLGIWYSILTILFRCPATLDECTETSPRVCKPYFQAKQAVLPHLSPYYDTYAAPYVDLAKPYYDTVDRVVITPTRTYAAKYGGPQLEKAQALGLAQWEKNVQPQLTKYQTLAKARYDQSVAPHINQATAATAPYYDIARTNALQTYHDVLLPSYQFVQPYAQLGYGLAASFATDTAIPSTLWAWNKTYLFLDSTVWPHLRDVYTLKVEPQLIRIIERLGRYRENGPNGGVQNGEPATQAAKSTFTKPSASISSPTAPAGTTTSESEPVSSSSASPEAETPEATAELDSAEQTPVKLTKEQIKEKAAKEVANDLELWQGKFTKAADEGGQEIEERIEDLAASMISEANSSGKALVSELDETVKTELANLKQTILTILETHKDESKPDQFEEQVTTAVRAAGLKIKNKAQEIRDWRETYEHEVEMAVTQAAQEHVHILEGIRDLALQKIGMRWAWMDGVTYKHWQEFHKLRETFDEWTEDLKRLVVTHPGLTEAQNAGNEVESEGMAIAGEAARELANLKQIAAWKAVAGDYSDDFDATSTRLAAEAAQKKAAEAAEALKRAAESLEEGVHSIADKVAENVESFSDSVSEGISSAVSPDSSSTTADGEAGTVTVSLSKANAEDTETSAVPPLQSMASEPTHSATDLASDSASTSSAEPTEPLPTSEPVDGPEQIEETIVSSPDEPTPLADSSTTTSSIKSALFGAAAASAPSRQPILDDDVGSSISSAISKVQSDVPHSITSAAQSAYTAALAEAANQYSRAMSAVSVQISGEPKPLHEELFSSASGAYFGALASANSQLNAALTAASEGVYGTPTTKWIPEMPTMPSVEWEKIQSIAQQNLQDSVNWAGEQYESAKVAIGLAEPTPSTALERTEKLLDQAKHNYYAGLGVAHARYSEFLSAASTAVSSLTATPTPTNIQESASSVAAKAASSANDAASQVAESWDSLVSQVSSQIYGAPTPTPWYAAVGDYAASANSVAADYASSAGDFAADNISSATSVAGEYADTASSAAASQYSVVSSLVSELIMGKEPTFTESIYSRLAGAYGIASATAASVASQVTASAASAASAAADTVSSATDKVKEQVNSVRDEL